jgi:hypothetical protein
MAQYSPRRSHKTCAQTSDLVSNDAVGCSCSTFKIIYKPATAEVAIDKNLPQKPTTMTAEWLPTELAKLLAAPHISFPNPPPNIHLGPGPIDLFSTYFNNIFATDVKSTVDGHKVSRDELKQKLLNLQKHWNPEKVKFEDDSSTPPVRRLLFRSSSDGLIC